MSNTAAARQPADPRGETALAVREEHAIGFMREVFTPEKYNAWKDRIAKAEHACPKIQVVDDESAKMAARAISALVGIKRDIESKRKAALAPFEDARDRLNRSAKELTDRLVVLETGLKGRVLAHRRKVQEEERQRVAAEEARKKREAEDLRQRAEQEREKADEIAASGDAGHAATVRQRAEVIEQRAERVDEVHIPEVVTPKTVRAETGASLTVRGVWKWKGEDLMTTVQAVAAGTAPLNVLQWNSKILNAMKPTKKKPDVPEVPGVEFYQEETVASR